MKKILLSLLALLLLAPTVYADRTERTFWEASSSTTIRTKLYDATNRYNVLINGNLEVTGTLTIAAILMTGNLDLDGYNFILDTDGDTILLNDRDAGVLDDEIDLQIAGAVDFTFSANLLTAVSGSAIATNTINETTGGSGVTIDSWQLIDGGAGVITGGTNTFNLTNGTASLDIAAGSALNVDANLTVEAASIVNQDLTTDGSPTFGSLTLTQPVVDAATPTALTVTGGAHTAITAATEDIGANLNFSATKTWAAGAGPLATQREFVLQAPTYVGNAGGALTMTDAYTLYVTGPPSAGANMTLTRPWAAGFDGNVGIGVGTVALPSLSFIGDPDTGIYNTANAIRFGTAGAARVVINSAGISVDTYNALAATTVTLRGTIADGATAIGVRFGNTNALVTAGAKIASFYSDNVTTERAYVNYLGSFNAGPGTVDLPAYSFAADPNTGFYNTAGNILSSIDGVLAKTLNATAGTIHVYRNSERQGTDIASASTIALAADGNTFELTGTTTVNLITSTNWQDGSKITLIANENVIINHATATSGANITILLSAAGNFSMTANDTLTLVLSTTTAGGQAWREVSRTVI